MDLRINNIKRNFRNEVVFMVHGYFRTRRSLYTLEKNISNAGFVVNNITYPTTKKHIFELAYMLNNEINKYDDKTIYHFVTHSMGALVVRCLLDMKKKDHKFNSKLGRIITIAAPHQGSKLAENLFPGPLRTTLLGPALDEINTYEFLPLTKVDTKMLNIVGNKKLWINPEVWIASMILDEPNDGVVECKESYIEHRNIHNVLIKDNHTFILKNKRTIEEVLFFLKKADT